MNSSLLEEVLKNKNRAVNFKVVFVDICSYSKRRSLTQAEVIDSFMACLESARMETARLYLGYSETNRINFVDDIIYLPAGDGAAICIPFEGLHDVHLTFAKTLLAAVHRHNEENNCDKYVENGWCNCHSNFDLTIGVSEGKSILYKDVNGAYNIAGNAINMASRVMGKAERGHIMFTDEAYKQLIDMVDDAHLDDSFSHFNDVSFKHDLKMTIHQYVDESLPYLNCEPPKDLTLELRMRKAMSQFAGLEGFGNGEIKREHLVDMFESMTNVINPLVDLDRNLVKTAPKRPAIDSKPSNSLK